jgi:hypothetical protein
VRATRRRHAPTCRHCPRVRLLGRDFQSWRQSWEAQRERIAMGYATECAEFAAANRPPTFKAYLIANAGTGWPMSGRQPTRRVA